MGWGYPVRQPQPFYSFVMRRVMAYLCPAVFSKCEVIISSITAALKSLHVNVFRHLVREDNAVQMVQLVAKAFGKIVLTAEGDFLAVFV